jgi:hypothetical protein
MRIVIGEASFAPDVARSMYDNIIARWQKSTALLLDRLVENGALRPHDTHMSARFLSGMVKETFVWPGLFKADHAIPENADAAIGEMVALFLGRYAMPQSEAATA